MINDNLFKISFYPFSPPPKHVAMMYSFFATCKANNTNPFILLNNIINRLPEYTANKLQELLPNNYLEEILRCTTQHDNYWKVNKKLEKSSLVFI